jgi:hypothetical protein
MPFPETTHLVDKAKTEEFCPIHINSNGQETCNEICNLRRLLEFDDSTISLESCKQAQSCLTTYKEAYFEDKMRNGETE